MKSTSHIKNKVWDVIVVGSGNAGLCAGIAALEKNKKVLMIEKTLENLSGGNTKYTAGAMRFVYNGNDDLLPLLKEKNASRLKNSDFGHYQHKQFCDDLLRFNEGLPLSSEQRTLIDKSYETMLWLAGHGVLFEPIYSRQSFKKDGKDVFWGGLTLAAHNEGVGLYTMERQAFERLGGVIRFNTPLVSLLYENNQVCGVVTPQGEIHASTVILACGGFESNAALRKELIGPDWEKAKVRGTPANTGEGLVSAFALGAMRHGDYTRCHATPMDQYMKDYGNLNIPHNERKNYRKISYFLGIMLNVNGERFVDEGADFRNYTYAQFGRAILEQPQHRAWQIFDAKVKDLLYPEYRFYDAFYIEENTLDTLINKTDITDKTQARDTIFGYNQAINNGQRFDPTIKDGKNTIGLDIPKSHWAQTIDTPPFLAYPVTAGITFTYGGLKATENGCVARKDGSPITGLYCCGEILGGVFFNGYPGGSGLTSGAVFGKIAGTHAADSC